MVVMVGDVIFGDVVGGGIPGNIMADDIPQRLVEIFRHVRSPDIVRMLQEANHAPAFRTFAVTRVELVLIISKK
jgi:hypothetical protein